MDDMTQALLDEVKGMRGDLQAVLVKMAGQEVRVATMQADHATLMQALAVRDRDGCGYCRHLPEELADVRADVARIADKVQPLVFAAEAANKTTPPTSATPALTTEQELALAARAGAWALRNWRTIGAVIGFAATLWGCDRVTTRLDNLGKAVTVAAGVQSNVVAHVTRAAGGVTQ